MKFKQPIFLTGRWENLVMLNYEIDPEVLLPYLPYAVELDLHQGKTLVSLVGFLFKQTKVFGVRWPFHTNFEEVNLRFYVKHFDGVRWKRGVVFISEIVPSPLISIIANKLYREPYSSKPMSHAINVNEDIITATYNWKHKSKWNSIAVTAEVWLNNIEPESEEQFIFEHYWGYNKYDDKTTIEYGVEHEMWQVHKVKSWKLDCDIAALYGSAFAPTFSKLPSSVFLAKGSDVLIRKPVFIRK